MKLHLALFSLIFIKYLNQTLKFTFFVLNLVYVFLMKKCKNKKLTIASSKTMKTKSENNRNIHVSDSQGTVKHGK